MLPQGRGRVFVDGPGDDMFTTSYGGRLVVTGDAGAAVDTERGVASGRDIGNDVLHHVRSVIGGPGDDVLVSSESEGRGGDDRLVAVDGRDSYLHGDDGDDTLIGADANDIVIGDEGDDTIRGGDGDDRLQPDTGDSGDTGVDTVNGGPGNDLFDVDAGPDTYDGGSGTDTLRYPSYDALVIDVPAGTVTRPSSATRTRWVRAARTRSRVVVATTRCSSHNRTLPRVGAHSISPRSTGVTGPTPAAPKPTPT